MIFLLVHYPKKSNVIFTGLETIITRVANSLSCSFLSPIELLENNKCEIYQDGISDLYFKKNNVYIIASWNIIGKTF